jgi:hypothetical protein
MAAMTKELQWEKIGNEHHAYRDRAHYVVYPYPRSGGDWNVALFSMFTDEPGGDEEKLGDYKELTTVKDGKKLAQALADQRRLTLTELDENE